jgi:hypothetical protein
MRKIFDKNGIEIEEFDILKVFHFVGVRKKKHYMYKMVILWNGYFYGSHLNNNPLTPDYPLWTSDYNPKDCEVVQSKNWDKL